MSHPRSRESIKNPTSFSIGLIGNEAMMVLTYLELRLLQIDTYGDGSGFSIQWGDVGIANFLIKRSHLKKLDFTQVLYNWDCS